MFILLTGNLGSGKSEVARHLRGLLRERSFEAKILNPDQLRDDFLAGKRSLGLKSAEVEKVRATLIECIERDKPFPPELKDLFYKDVHREIFNAGPRDVFIVDARNARQAERDSLVDMARDLGVPAHVVWMDAPLDVLKKRVLRRTREENPLAYGTGGVAILEKLFTSYETPRPPFIRISCAVSKDEDPHVNEKNARLALEQISVKNNVGAKNLGEYASLYAHEV